MAMSYNAFGNGLISDFFLGPICGYRWKSNRTSPEYPYSYVPTIVVMILFISTFLITDKDYRQM